MTNIAINCNEEEKMVLPIDNDGKLPSSSLKQDFLTDDLSNTDEDIQSQTSTISPDEILRNPSHKEYNLPVYEAEQQINSFKKMLNQKDAKDQAAEQKMDISATNLNNEDAKHQISIFSTNLNHETTKKQDDEQQIATIATNLNKEEAEQQIETSTTILNKEYVREQIKDLNQEIEQNNVNSSELPDNDFNENNGLCEKKDKQKINEFYEHDVKNSHDQVNRNICDEEFVKEGMDNKVDDQNSKLSNNHSQSYSIKKDDKVYKNGNDQVNETSDDNFQKKPNQIESIDNTVKDDKNGGDETTVNSGNSLQSKEVKTSDDKNENNETSKSIDLKATEKDINKTEAKQDIDTTNDNKTEERVKSNAAAEKKAKKSKKLTKPYNLIKTLRVGWLHRTTKDREYEKMKKPLGGVKRLKISKDSIYSADEIKRMAISEFNDKKKRRLEDEYDVEFGLADGDVLNHFYMTDGRICDIWGYCKSLNTTPYKLNVFLLTMPKTAAIVEKPVKEKTAQSVTTKSKKPGKKKKGKSKVTNNSKSKIKDSVHVFYHHTKVSKYSSEPSATELEKPNLHVYVLEEQYGDGPELNEFEPVDYGYFISRIKLDSNIIFEVYYNEDYIKCFTFPTVVLPTVGDENHIIVYDTDKLQGYCCGKYGVGMITSCTELCKPIFTWYRDGEVYKTGEFLYWLNCTDCGDNKSHVWSCSVKCKGKDSELKSKKVTI